jgi:hypothetical protein
MGLRRRSPLYLELGKVLCAKGNPQSQASAAPKPISAVARCPPYLSLHAGVSSRFWGSVLPPFWTCRPLETIERH